MSHRQTAHPSVVRRRPSAEGESASRATGAAPPPQAGRGGLEQQAASLLAETATPELQRRLPTLTAGQLGRRRWREAQSPALLGESTAAAQAARQPPNAFGASSWQPGIRVSRARYLRPATPDPSRSYRWLDDDLALVAAVVDSVIWDNPRWAEDVFAARRPRAATPSRDPLAPFGAETVEQFLDIAGLSPREVQALCRREIDGWTSAEIGAELGCSPKGARDLLHAARRRCAETRDATRLGSRRRIRGGQRVTLFTDVLVVDAARRALASGEVRRFREARGMSLRDLAVVIACSASSLSAWERGRTAPSANLALAIGKLLGLAASAADLEAVEAA